MPHQSPRHPFAAPHTATLWFHSHPPQSQDKAEQEGGEENMSHLQRRSKENSLGSCSVMPGFAGDGKKTSFSQLAPMEEEWGYALLHLPSHGIALGY